MSKTPDDLLDNLSANTQVGTLTLILTGKVVFYGTRDAGRQGTTVHDYRAYGLAHAN